MIKIPKQLVIYVAYTLGALCLNSLPVSAAPNAYQKNVERMDAILQSRPNDESAHYYRAVSLQYMGEYKRAKEDYEWVINNGKNAGFKQQSTLALQGLMKTLYGVGLPRPVRPVIPPSPYTSSKTTVAIHRKATSPTTLASSGSNNSDEKSGDKPKVYEFYTDWCHVCQSHASEYAALQTEAGSKVDFQQLNAEDPTNRELVQRFGVQAYPTFVFVNSNGTEVFNKAGGYSREQLKHLMEERLGVQL